jgi:hypothetical protein
LACLEFAITFQRNARRPAEFFFTFTKLEPAIQEVSMRSLLLAVSTILIIGSASAQNNPSGPTQSAPPAPAARSAPTGPAGATANTAAITNENQAKAKIESSGFSNVTALTKDNSGIWHASAMKDGMSVKVALDAQGNVKTE